MKEKLEEYRIYAAVIAVLICLAIIIFAWKMGSRHISVQNYINVTFNGVNGYGTAQCVVDKDELYKAIAGDEKSIEKLDNYRKIADSVTAEVTETGISNGSRVSVNVSYNSELAKQCHVSIGSEKYSVKAEGIPDGEPLDLFENVQIVFAGMSPDAYVVIKNNWKDDYLKTLTFSADKITGISRDDKVVVACNADAIELGAHGYAVKTTQIEYTADKLSSYADSKELVDINKVGNLKKNCENIVKNIVIDKKTRIMYKATGNMEYLYEANDQTADNVGAESAYYIIRKNENEGDIHNALYICVSADITCSGETNTVWFIFTFEDCYNNSEGTFNVSTDDLKNVYECSTDYEELYNNCIGKKADMYNIIKLF